MGKRPTVLVDMDGVLSDFDAEIVSRMKERYPNIPILGTRNNFYISDDYPEYSETIKQLSNEEGFFESLRTVDDALEGWQKIIDLGYNPRICSAPIRANPYCQTEKVGWLRRNFVPVFGHIVVEQAIITKEKHLYEGMALIDDRPEVDRSSEAPWQHIVFDKPYNQNSNSPRLKGWLDDNLPFLLESAMEDYRNKF